MKSRTKYRLLKLFGIFLDIIVVILATSICAILKVDDLWKEMDGKGFTLGWLSTIIYRISIFFIPGVILSFFVFDKRYKYISRLKIWLNWTMCIYLITNAFIKVFALDKAFGFEFFNNVDVVVLLTGYIITFVTKEKVSLDSTEAIINPKHTD